MKPTVRELDLVRIAARASSLRERLAAGWKAKVSASPERGAERLDRWKKAIAGDDGRYFARRLEWSGLSEPIVLPLLDEVEPVNASRLPVWTKTLRRIHREALRSPRKTRESLDEALPFDDFFTAHLAVARRMLLMRLFHHGLATREGVDSSLIGREAFKALETHLLKRLIDLSLPTLFAEFHKFEEDETGEGDLYQRFRDHHFANGLRCLLEAYPVLGRLHATVVDDWVAECAELLLRLRDDREALGVTFGGHPDLRPLAGLRMGLSYPANHGRTVCILEFERGLKVVYKPKSLGMEAAYAGLIEWFSRNGSPVPLGAARVLDRGAYGWMEFIEGKPLENPGAAERFYRNAGALTAVLHLLRATDCHRDNFIVRDELLYPIDAETLCQHTPVAFAQKDGSDRLPNGPEMWVAESVLRTLMLPGQFLSDEREGLDRPDPGPDVSGFGCADEGPRTGPAQRWVDVNTARMRCEHREEEPCWSPAAPLLDGRPVSAFGHLDDIKSGFVAMYRYLVSQRRTLLAPGSPLEAFQGVEGRFVLRATSIYFAVMDRSLHPEALRDGVERGIHLDLLARAFIVSPEKPQAWPMVEEEIGAIERLDIPSYRTNSSSAALDLGNGRGVIDGYFRSASYGEMRAHLREMGGQDLAQQLLLLDAPFHAKWLHRRPDACFPDAERALNTGQRMFGPRGLDATAGWIARRLRKRAIQGANGEVAWLGLHGGETSAASIGLLGPSPFHGSVGIAFFLASYDAVTAGTRHGGLVGGALERLRNTIGPGASCGVDLSFADIARLVIMLCRIAEAYRDVAPGGLARECAASFAADYVAAISTCDSLDVLAIWAMALDVLGRRFVAPWISEHADQCCDRIIHLTSSGQRPAGSLISLAYAVLALHGRDQKGRPLSLGRSLLRKAADGETSGNCRDGGLLIGLSRRVDSIDPECLALISLTLGNAVVNVKRRVLEKASMMDDPAIFEAGAFLCEASGFLGRPELGHCALDAVNPRIERAMRHGDGFHCDRRLPRSAAVDGFARGHAGIGYAMLRMAHPGRLPVMPG